MTDEREQLLELSTSMLETSQAIRKHLAGPLAPDAEVRSWPLWAGEGDCAGGVWCGDEGCPLQAENSEIGDFRDRVFTLDDLHAAIGAHIAVRRDREGSE